MKNILGTKVNMIQYFAPDGTSIPATIVSAGPVVVTSVKKTATDGYEAVQVGFGEQKKERVSKAVLGQNKDLGAFKYIKEFRIPTDGVELGSTITAAVFAAGDTVRVTGISKGKGFQGVVKRHGFGGGRRSHGQKHSEREAGSIGGGLRTRVPKGMRMAGRMGSDTVTIKNLKVLAVDEANNQIIISGALPGKRGTLLAISA
jgi:large subunit ribosomal protein L3